MSTIVQLPVRRSARLIYSAVVVAWFVYVLLLVLGPNDPTNTFRLGLSSANFIRVMFALPILVIWLISARAAIGFRNYTRLIGVTPEGRSFQIIARGLIWLLAYLILLLALGRLSPLFADMPTLSAVTIFLKNHLPIYILFISFAHLYYGSSQLLHQTNIVVPRRRMISIWVGYFIFSALFTYLFFVRPITPAADNIPAFAVSHDALLFTMVIPSLFAWILGIVASVNLSIYAFYSRGIIYKDALRSLVQGVYASTMFAIAVQLLILNSAYLRELGTARILIILYALFIAYAIGAVLIDRGARRLARIEEVTI